jgi:polysaccharide biosynthesis/export protein
MNRIGHWLLVPLLAFVPLTAEAQVEAPAPEAEITLLPGDLLRIAIWREAGLSGDFPVETDGTVTLPLLGRQQVTAIPLDRLRDTLIAQYRVELRNPSIAVTPLRRVNVMGEVARPGLYSVDPTITLQSAIALAGGVTASGHLQRISITRAGQVLRPRAGAAENLSALDVRSGDEIFVARRGWFDRNSTFVVSALLSLTSIMITILR